MERAICILACILSLCSCDLLEPTSEKVPYNGHLVGVVKYMGASTMNVDNVIVTLTGISDDAETVSKRIDNIGSYDLSLSAGRYKIELSGNRCISEDLPDTVIIVAGETTSKDMHIEQLPSTMVILYNDAEYKSGETMVLGSAAVLDIWNKHSGADLTWEIEAYSDSSWISFKTLSGTVQGGGRKSIVFGIDKTKMKIGLNKADIIITTSDNGSFSVAVEATKEEESTPVVELVTLDTKHIMIVKSDPDEEEMSWQNARNSCSAFQAGGYDDWRLPEVDEMITLYDSKTILGVALSGGYWTNSIGDNSSYYRQCIVASGFLGTSSAVDAYPFEECHFRCVRTVDDYKTFVRFEKKIAYTHVTEMSLTDIYGDVLTSHVFGTAEGTSQYYEVPWGELSPCYYNDSPDYKGEHYCLPNPYSYDFRMGHKYTVVCGDDGEYLTFSVSDDGGL